MNFPPKKAAFTLVELMVSTAIIGLIMVVLVAMTNQTSRTWRSTTEKIEKFQEARDGFEAMTRRLSQATLNTYWDYLDQNGKPRDTNVNDTAFKTFIPYMYGRASNLRFASGPMSQQYAASGVAQLGEAGRLRPTHGIFFQAPFGVVTPTDAQSSTTDYGVMNNLLNTWGYFVEADIDTTRPAFVNMPGAHVLQRWRSRLMEFMLPSEQMNLFDYGPANTTYGNAYGWFNLFTPVQPQGSGIVRPVHVLAENVVALVLAPKLSNADQAALNQLNGGTPVLLSANYAYDSTLTVNPGPNGYAGGNSNIAASINPKNQLPPIVSVTMVAIDDRSAERLFDKYCTPFNPDGSGGPSRLSPSPAEATMGLSNYMTGLFTNSLTLETTNGDLAVLEAALTGEGCTYRVFTTNVTIRGAKWSRSQTK